MMDVNASKQFNASRAAPPSSKALISYGYCGVGSYCRSGAIIGMAWDISITHSTTLTTYGVRSLSSCHANSTVVPRVQPMKPMKCVQYNRQDESLVIGSERVLRMSAEKVRASAAENNNFPEWMRIHRRVDCEVAKS